MHRQQKRQQTSIERARASNGRSPLITERNWVILSRKRGRKGPIPTLACAPTLLKSVVFASSLCQWGFCRMAENHVGRRKMRHCGRPVEASRSKRVDFVAGRTGFSLILPAILDYAELSPRVRRSGSVCTTTHWSVVLSAEQVESAHGAAGCLETPSLSASPQKRGLLPDERSWRRKRMQQVENSMIYHEQFC